MNSKQPFKWKNFQGEIILLCYKHIIKIREGYSFQKIFGYSDLVGKLTVFNIGGNKYRLITAIHFNRQKVYVRNVLTHKEYDRGDWKE